MKYCRTHGVIQRAYLRSEKHPHEPADPPRPAFDERTGRPGLDALARRDNRTLRRITRDTKRLRFEVPRRKRKKYLIGVEGHRYMYMAIVNVVAKHAFEKRYGPNAPKRPLDVELPDIDDRRPVRGAPAMRGTHPLRKAVTRRQ